MLTGAAREPEILDLIDFLRGCGANIAVELDGTILVEGVEQLKGTEHRVIPDRVAAGTYLCAAAMTGGELLTAFRRHAVSAGVEFRTGKVLTSVPAKDAWYVSIGSDMEQAAALVLAGGVGNLIDRAFRGFVVDMFNVLFVRFAVFNVADCCITVGVPLLFLYVLLYVGRDEKKEDKADESAQLPSDGH